MVERHTGKEVLPHRVVFDVACLTSDGVPGTGEKVLPLLTLTASCENDRRVVQHLFGAECRHVAYLVQQA